jgi:hypothetical protein
VGFDLAIAEEHCAQNDDPNFCESPLNLLDRWIIRFRRGVVVPDLDRDIATRHFLLPFVNGGVALIAPIGQIFAFDENTFRARKLFIVGLEDDEITRPEFHAKNLPSVLPEREISHFSIRPGHHFAFIAPFADRIPNKENIPPAVDPPGFDRKAFLDELNQDLVDFFLDQS